MRAPLTLIALVSIVPAVRAQPVDPYQPDRAPPAPTAPAPAPGPVQGPAAPPPAAAPAQEPAAPAAPAPTPAAPPVTPGDAPQDPYAAAPSGAPMAQDPVLVERVAQALVTRAQELLDAKVYLDAKQLAVEALVQSPRGRSAEKARAIIHAVNQQLGIPEDSPRPTAAPAPVEDVDTSPILDPTLPPAPLPPPEGQPRRGGKLTSMVHGGLYAGLLGTTIGSFLGDEPAAGGIPLGLAAGAAGAFAVPRLVDRVHWSENQVRTVGAATVWGGMIGGLIGDIAKTQDTSAREVLVAASIGSTIGGLGGYAYSRGHKLTQGDLALIDTLAGVGAVGGVTLGMVMQPAETEAYSLNSVLGIAGGVVVGLVAAPQTNTTPRRMVRVAGFSAIGAAAPFLLYLAIRDAGSTADERITGLLSIGGMLGGGYLGLRMTRGMDAGLDRLDNERKDPDDAPLALVGRSSAGHWRLGGVSVAPLSRALAPQQGMALQLVGGAF